MSHFDISEWTDFVRGVVGGERQAGMQGHLAACTACASTCALLRKVVSASLPDKAWKVPAELAASAEAIFASRQQVRPSLLERVVGRLVYDNLAELQPMGARAGYASSRQLAFQAGDYYLDLSIERDATRVSLLGQLGCRKEPAAAVPGVQVLLMAGVHLAARAVTNEFGEFSLEFRPRKNVRLCFPHVAGGAQIEIPLEDLQ